LLNTAVPDAKRVGVLWDSDYPAAELREIERAARSLNLELIPIDVRNLDELEPGLRRMVEQRGGRSDRGAGPDLWPASATNG
jgi:ABC-type uncharacterized transport system substrate-binding protein